MMISEWTLLVLLMVPIAAFVVGALLIAVWSQATSLIQSVNSVLVSSAPRHTHSILHNASR